MHVATGLCRAEISEPESFSLNDVAYGHKDVATELWAPVAERVKLPPFAAGIDTWWQFRQELLIVLPTHELLVQLLWVHAGQDRPQTSIQHLTSQVGRVLCAGPDREQRLHPGPLQESDPVLPDVGEEKVAERNVGDPRSLRLSNRSFHPILIDLV